MLDIRFLELVNASKETTPNWKALHGTEEKFSNMLFEEFTHPENESVVEAFMEAQKQFDSDKDVSDFTRETFLHLLCSFIVANKLPISFTENNPTLSKIFGFCANMINNAKKISPTSPSISATTILTLPCSQTIKNNIIAEFDIKKNKVKEVLKSQMSLNFTADLWKSPTSTVYILIGFGVY